jgi:hypothetical protein
MYDCLRGLLEMTFEYSTTLSLWRLDKCNIDLDAVFCELLLLFKVTANLSPSL